MLAMSHPTCACVYDLSPACGTVVCLAHLHSSATCSYSRPDLAMALLTASCDLDLIHSVQTLKST